MAYQNICNRTVLGAFLAWLFRQDIQKHGAALFVRLSRLKRK